MVLTAYQHRRSRTSLSASLSHTPSHQEEATKLLNELLEAGIIEYSCSSWQSPALVIKKPAGGLRLVLDYRQLNQIIDRQPAEVPKLQQLTDHMAGNQLFSVMDAASGYYSIPLNDPVSRSKTAFALGDNPQCQFKKIPRTCFLTQNLRNSSQHHQNQLVTQKLPMLHR